MKQDYIVCFTLAVIC